MSRGILEQRRKELAAQIERAEAEMTPDKLTLTEFFVEKERVAELKDVLGKMDSILLQKKAARLGIAIPHKAEWYDSNW